MDKMKVIRTVTTVEGTLYEGEVVRFQEVEKMVTIELKILWAEFGF